MQPSTNVGEVERTLTHPQGEHWMIGGLLYGAAPHALVAPLQQRLVAVKPRDEFAIRTRARGVAITCARRPSSDA